jgi:outer membrane lipoprotein SlyB
MKSFRTIALYSTSLLLAACASTPMGPTVRALPPQGKSWDQFQSEQFNCKQYADSQVSGQADRANSTGILEGVGGTVLGAGLGAALGGGHGAAVGAGLGAVGGTAVGASTSGHEQRSIQVQYNDAYVQCMVAKGNQIDRPVVYSQPSTTVIYTQPAPPPTVIYTQPAPPPTVVYTQPAPPSEPPAYYGH